jgi:hypothetical protein
MFEFDSSNWKLGLIVNFIGTRNFKDINPFESVFILDIDILSFVLKTV